jgi:subtilisin-like proprotein convertase family protein
MLKSKLSRGIASKRRRKNRQVQPAEILEPKVLLSATSTDVHQGSAEEVTARIVNGNETDDYEAVGIVNNGCTGTLISPTHVLTAAHCTEGIGDRQGTFDVGGQTYRTSDVIDHPQYNPNRFDVGYDISIMELDRAVSGVEPAEILRDAPQVGQLLTLVGFGEGGTSRGGSLNDFGTKRVGETEIDSLTNLHVEWNFDSHNESNTAPGDSGGPAFVTVGNELFIAGVTSGGSGDAHTLGDNSFDTRVDTFASWIDGIVGDGGDDDGGNDDDDGGSDDGGGGSDDRFEFSNDQGKTIRDDRVHTINSKIDVSGLQGNITDLNIQLDIDHTWTEDLQVQLFAPDGTRITLFNAVGGDGQDFNNTGLDDEAGESIENADAPFRGVFKPTGDLSKFDGKDPNGTWKLRIRDKFAEDGGRLNSWKVSFQTDADNTDDNPDGDGGSDDSNSGSFTNNKQVNIRADRANTIQSKLNVAGLQGGITDVNVKLNIDHTWDSDLLVTLVSPSGTRVQLVRYAGDDGDGFVDTVFDDSSADKVQLADAPFTGTFKPRQSLTKFNNEDPNGVWTLVVRDRFEEDGGALKNWTLTLETEGSNGRSADSGHNLTRREMKKNRLHSVRSEMRKGRVNRVSPTKVVRQQIEDRDEAAATTEASNSEWLESYRETKIQTHDRLFSLSGFDQLFGSL